MSPRGSSRQIGRFGAPSCKEAHEAPGTTRPPGDSKTPRPGGSRRLEKRSSEAVEAARWPKPTQKPEGLWQMRQDSFGRSLWLAGASGTGGMTPAAWHIRQFAFPARSWLVALATGLVWRGEVAE
jgi:hypothetical protein